MTVAELIEKLKTFPPNADVIYRCCSDYEILESNEVQLHSASDKKIKFRQGRYSWYSDWEFTKPGYECHDSGEQPVFRDVVTFPGN